MGGVWCTHNADPFHHGVEYVQLVGEAVSMRSSRIKALVASECLFILILSTLPYRTYVITSAPASFSNHLHSSRP